MHITNAPSSQVVVNWFKFFQEERELWIKNVSSTQLSMQFDVAPGHATGVLVPIGPNPICLTNEVPFETIKKSLDFRRFLNKVPKVMELLTTEGAHEYFASTARAAGMMTTDTEGRTIPDIDAAIMQAEVERRAQQARAVGDPSTITAPDGQVHFLPPKSAQELQGTLPERHEGIPMGAAAAAGVQHVPQGYLNTNGTQAHTAASYAQTGAGMAPSGYANLGHEPVMLETVISPRVLNLCQQVSSQVPPNSRMPADQLWNGLKQLEATLTFDEYAYIESNVPFRTVKKWARDKQAKMNASAHGEGIEDGLKWSPEAE